MEVADYGVFALVKCCPTIGSLDTVRDVSDE
jgi:hypothetical protein